MNFAKSDRVGNTGVQKTPTGPNTIQLPMGVHKPHINPLNLEKTTSTTNSNHNLSSCHCKMKSQIETKSVGCGTNFVSKKPRKLDV